MTVIYGQRGQPAATVEDDVLFRSDGTQWGMLDDGYIFSVVDGSHIGSFVNGVVFNAFGDVEGFAEECGVALPLVRPNTGMLPPRVTAIGRDVRELPPVNPPDFLRAKLTAARSEWFK